jgi:DNA-binding MarR family transcriptional regulator
MSIDESIAATEEVHGACLCFRAQKAARAMARRFDAALRPYGLTSGQFSLLNAVNQTTPPSMAELAALLGVDRTTLTASVKPMVRRGLIRVAVDAADRRGRRLSITADGRALLRQTTPAWRACHASLDTRLGEGGAERLRQDLEALAGTV